MTVNNKISWIHLTSKPRQLIVAALSVTFGISMYVFMNSFTHGVNKAQTELTFNAMSHIKVYNDLPAEERVRPHVPSDTIFFTSNQKRVSHTEGIKNTDPIKRILESQPDITAMTEQLNENVFFRNGALKVNGVLSGIDVENENRLFKTAQYMQTGDLSELDRRIDGIVLATGLAGKIGAAVGDAVYLTTTSGVSRIYKVIGVLETGTASIDRTKALISIAAARSLLSKNRSYATDVLANVRDYNDARAIVHAVSSAIPYKTEPWQEGNTQLESANILRDMLSITVSASILIVAGFGIYNIMNITVNEKMQEIAILKAIGFDGHDIVGIFLTQSLIIGLIGGTSGLLLGYAISAIIDYTPFRIASLTTLPISYEFADYALALAFGLITTFLAGYLPARKASKIDPVEILRR